MTLRASSEVSNGVWIYPRCLVKTPTLTWGIPFLSKQIDRLAPPNVVNQDAEADFLPGDTRELLGFTERIGALDHELERFLLASFAQ